MRPTQGCPSSKVATNSTGEDVEACCASGESGEQPCSEKEDMAAVGRLVVQLYQRRHIWKEASDQK